MRGSERMTENLHGTAEAISEAKGSPSTINFLVRNKFREKEKREREMNE